MRAHLSANEKELASNVTLADTLPARLRGLLGKDRLPEGDGLLIRPCKGIHTFFMKFPIDAVFLDRDNLVVALFRSLPPNRITPVYLKAVSVLELPAGTLETEIAMGERIIFS
jgi:uncharacterized membrane protein (UPF0127 family)